LKAEVALEAVETSDMALTSLLVTGVLTVATRLGAVRTVVAVITRWKEGGCNVSRDLLKYLLFNTSSSIKKVI